ncbi:hypothetical protein YTPLAS18_01510 [Nitrospira sp.]|nr:hypothetical protein YTPLAS18_01510 [Nitrospira sp.]
MKVFLLGERRVWGRRDSVLHTVVAIVMIVAVIHVALLPAAWAETREEGATESTGSQAGMGAAVFFSNLLYMPAKFVYAILGGVVGGLAYPLSGMDDKVAKRIWDASLRGTYVLTPDHLRGDRPVRFLGVPQEEEDASSLSSPSPAAAPMPAN